MLGGQAPFFRNGPGRCGLIAVLADLYAVQHGAVTLFSPDGPLIGETSRIGGARRRWSLFRPR
jgi:hypothetical protein